MKRKRIDERLASSKDDHSADVSDTDQDGVTATTTTTTNNATNNNSYESKVAANLDKQLLQIDQKSHPDFLKAHEEIELWFTEQKQRIQILHEHRVDIINREYKKEIEACDRECENEKKRIQSYLVSLCEELKRRLEHDKKNIELTASGDILEYKPAITRKLRRRAGGDLNTSNQSNFVYWGDLLLCGTRWPLTQFNSHQSSQPTNKTANQPNEPANSEFQNNNPHSNSSVSEFINPTNAANNNNNNMDSIQSDSYDISNKSQFTMHPMSTGTTTTTVSSGTPTLTESMNSKSNNRNSNLFGSLGINLLDGNLLSHLLASSVSHNNTLSQSYLNASLMTCNPNATTGTGGATTNSSSNNNNNNDNDHVNSNLNRSSNNFSENNPDNGNLNKLNHNAFNGLSSVLANSSSDSSAAVAAVAASLIIPSGGGGVGGGVSGAGAVLGPGNGLTSAFSSNSLPQPTPRKRRQQTNTPSAQLNLLLPEHDIYADLIAIHRACTKGSNSVSNSGSIRKQIGYQTNTQSSSSSSSASHFNYSNNAHNLTSSLSLSGGGGSNSGNYLPDDELDNACQTNPDHSSSFNYDSITSFRGLRGANNNNNNNNNRTGSQNNQQFSAWIDDGRLYYGQKCYQNGAFVVLEGRDGSSHKCTGSIVSIGAQDVAIRRNSDHGICRVTVQQLKQGRYVLLPTKKD